MYFFSLYVTFTNFSVQKVLFSWTACAMYTKGKGEAQKHKRLSLKAIQKTIHVKCFWEYKYTKGNYHKRMTNYTETFNMGF